MHSWRYPFLLHISQHLCSFCLSTKVTQTLNQRVVSENTCNDAFLGHVGK
ncbi:hypothetical protein HanXRQr2_Chr07g0314181 [Helianthus annuus]|uniref:Uncharacterized protein n=1 Tax=Helianthus annuus TaxID=4232 RepID=A0A9K3NH53_HELAN|nr:hypothetical protein HanXRQr2_Chr07g0314181 [Helianthus annuus]